MEYTFNDSCLTLTLLTFGFAKVGGGAPLSPVLRGATGGGGWSALVFLGEGLGAVTGGGKEFIGGAGTEVEGGKLATGAGVETTGLEGEGIEFSVTTVFFAAFEGGGCEGGGGKSASTCVTCKY